MNREDDPDFLRRSAVQFDVDNRLRSAMALAMIKAWIPAEYLEKNGIGDDDIIDSITALFHLAFEMGFDTDQILEFANMNFDAELQQAITGIPK